MVGKELTAGPGEADLEDRFGMSTVMSTILAVVATGEHMQKSSATNRDEAITVPGWTIGGYMLGKERELVHGLLELAPPRCTHPSGSTTRIGCQMAWEITHCWGGKQR